MFRCLSLLGAAAVALGVAALVSLTKPAPVKVPKALPRPRQGRRPARFVRVPGLIFHPTLSAN